MISLNAKNYTDLDATGQEHPCKNRHHKTHRKHAERIPQKSTVIPERVSGVVFFVSYCYKTSYGKFIPIDFYELIHG